MEPEPNSAMATVFPLTARAVTGPQFLVSSKARDIWTRPCGAAVVALLESRGMTQHRLATRAIVRKSVLKKQSIEELETLL